MGPLHPNIKLGTGVQYTPSNLTTQQSGSSNVNIYGADLGRTVLQNGNWYRLVKNGAADIVNAAGKWLVTATNATKGTGAITNAGEPTTAGNPLGAPTWVVSLAGARLTIGRTQKLAGVVPFPFFGSDGSTSLKANDYFYIQISGIARAHGNSLVFLRSLAVLFGVNSVGGLSKDSLIVCVKSLNAAFWGQGAFPAYPLYSIVVAQ